MLLCLACTYVSAQQTEASQEKVLTDKEKKAERGVAKIGKKAATVVEKGDWMFGGSVKGSYFTGMNHSIAVIKGIDTRGYGFNFKPQVMYAVAKNFGVGVRANIKRNVFDLDGAHMEMGETKIELKDVNSVNMSYGGSIFARYYIPIGPTGRYSIIGDLILSGEGGTSKFSQKKQISGQETPVGTYQKNWGVGANIDFGLMAFFTKHFAMEAELGILGFGVTGSKSVENQVYEGSYSMVNPYFDINFLSLTVGACIYF